MKQNLIILIILIGLSITQCENLPKLHMGKKANMQLQHMDPKDMNLDQLFADIERNAEQDIPALNPQDELKSNSLQNAFKNYKPIEEDNEPIEVVTMAPGLGAYRFQESRFKQVHQNVLKKNSISFKKVLRLRKRK